jgi:hypothetical protein
MGERLQKIAGVLLNVSGADAAMMPPSESEI